MLKKINGLSIFLTILIAWLFVKFYSIVEEQERPQSKAEVSRIIRENFFKQKTRFTALAEYATTVKSYSKDWYFENDAEKKLNYFSSTPIDSCKMPLDSYIKKYYGTINPTTDPCCVPDFIAFSGLQQLLDSLQLNKLHYVVTETCGKRCVSFEYKNAVFTPEPRTVYYKYFPDGICKEMMDKIKNSDNKWNWAYYLDKNWVAQSVREKH